ncbi:MAG: FG-GAP-like repeat-containing protein [Myxococcota bacterium]|nr:FG-GAP-like repeat-containing protein [Myxococcota bacterium]
MRVQKFARCLVVVFAVAGGCREKGITFIGDMETSGSDPDPYIQQFQKYIIDDDIPGPAFATVGDVDGNGQVDLVVSTFGPRGNYDIAGSVRLYLLQGGLSQWSSAEVLPESQGIRFPNKISLRDMNGDGKLDVLVPAGFFACYFMPQVSGPCGALLWMEQTPSGWVRHDIMPMGSESYYHVVHFDDVNDDGFEDLISVAEKRRLVVMPDGGKNLVVDTAYPQVLLALPPHQDAIPPADSDTQSEEGTDSDLVIDTDSTSLSVVESDEDTETDENTDDHPALFQIPPINLLEHDGKGLGGLPELFDVDGDGDLDIVSAEFFLPKDEFSQFSFAWLERAAPASAKYPAGRWVRHVIADDLGPSIQIGLVNGLIEKGQVSAVGSNHTNTRFAVDDPESQIVLFESIPKDPKARWPYRKISEGIRSREATAAGALAAPGIFAAGDVDGDGDMDLLVSGDGDARVFILEQTSKGKFKTHVLTSDFGQAGCTIIVDLDGDGDNELIVSSYEQNEIRVYSMR